MAELSEKRTIVVTGAGSGIGRACCLRLATADANIVALDRDNAAAAATVKLVEKAGFSGVAIECDVTRR